VSLGATDIVLEEPTVKGDGLSELLNPAIRPGVETTTPGFLSHVLFSCSLKMMRNIVAMVS
jgi:hypothetical protein